MDTQARPHVVIVGCGFGGLYAARALRWARVRITVIDRHNYHLFQPMLYEVAGAALTPSDIAFPIRSALRGNRHLEVRLGEVVDVDPGARTLQLADGAALSWDYCILAPGVETSYFGHEDAWEPLAPGLKALDDALDIRRRVLLAFEKAENEGDNARRARELTFVVVGGGPSGVEMAGIIAELRRYTLTRDFRNIDPRDARVILIEGGPRILPTYPGRLGAYARRCLTDLGVEVRENVLVEDLQPGVVVAAGERIPAAAVIWCAGMRAPTLLQRLGVPLDRAGRVVVGPDCTVPGHRELFVIGDAASMADERMGTVPGVAPGAMQMGRYVADAIRRDLEGRARVPFRYTDKGSLAVIGRGRAVASIWRLQFGGFVAWLIWALVHIAHLVGFRNRFLVMIQWGWLYFWYAKGARIIGSPPPPRGPAARASGT